MTQEKTKAKDKVFTADGIKKEMKRFRWASKETMIGSVLQTVIFVGFFVVLFLLSDLVLSLIFRI